MGIENLTHPSFKKLKAEYGVLPRIGLITNQTGVDQLGRRTIDILQQEGLRIVYILAPEHGIEGKEPAGKPIANSVDRKTGIPVQSIYGRGGDQSTAGKQIDPAIMKQIDVLIYDIQDSGIRHYTYISTMLCALNAASTHKKPVYILDRPNLLGKNMEGPLVDPGLESFISIASIPLRHGMTVGELAQFFNAHVLKNRASLHVIPMAGYTRGEMVPFLASLSPNLKSKQSVYGYSFLGLLSEIRPFDVGVGTPMAFQSILLSERQRFSPHEWGNLSVLLRKFGIHTRHEILMRTKFSHSGLRLQFPPEANFASFDLLLTVIEFFKKRGVLFEFSALFDKAAGTEALKGWCAGTCSLASFKSKVKAGLQEFYKKAESSFLYTPYPEIKV